MSSMSFYYIKDVCKSLEAMELPIHAGFLADDFPNQETITAQRLSDWFVKEHGSYYGTNIFKHVQTRTPGYILLERAV